MPEDKKKKATRALAFSRGDIVTRGNRNLEYEIPALASRIKGQQSSMATIGPDVRTPAQKAQAAAAFQSMKKAQEAQGADFETPTSLQQRRRQQAERTLQAVNVGLTGASLIGGGVKELAKKAIPSAPAKVAEVKRGVEFEFSDEIMQLVKEAKSKRLAQRTFQEKVVDVVKKAGDKAINLTANAPTLGAVTSTASEAALKIIPEELQNDKLKEILGSFIIKKVEPNQDVAAKKVASKSSYGQYRKIGTGKEK